MSEIHTGDAFEVLDQLDANSVHAIVTDPPYGLAFMGRSWDDFEPKEYQEWCAEWAGKAMRVLKPGGHMVAFSGNRTHHRLFTGVEDAGYEIRDTVTWHYGSGFPKALDVSKAIDKAAGAERDKIPNPLADKQTGQENTDALSGDREPNETIAPEPATDAAERWDGFKTALKPATEYVVMARKPFDGTVAENIQEHGTGALNIDGTRIDTDENLDGGATKDTERPSGWSDTTGGMFEKGSKRGIDYDPEGRYPANVVFDEQAADELDDVTRYFYTSKATKAERTLDGKIENAHPTVKPTDLMEWLVTLVTAEKQIVLDPFIGSGTTGMACKNTNRDFIGIEQNPEYADIARVRCGLTPDDPSVVRDSAEHGLEAFIDT